jgi:hypothetical protein
MAAIPIAGIAAMKKVTVTFAPVIGFPSWPVSFTRTMLLPLCGHQQGTQQPVALLGNRSQLLPTARTFLAWNQSHITGHLFAPAKAAYITVDLGATLRTEPYDKESEQWSLFTPSHKVLRLRADRRYNYMRSDAPSDEGTWKPVLK